MKDFQTELDVFQKALDIDEPWFVSSHDLNLDTEELYIYLNFPRGAKFTCSSCGAKKQPVHDIVDEGRCWRHLDFWEYKTILNARLPRTRCKQCGKIRTIHVNWARPQAGFSYKLDLFVLSLMKEMPVAAVARQVGEHDTRLWRVFNHFLGALEKRIGMYHSNCPDFWCA